MEENRRVSFALWKPFKTLILSEAEGSLNKPSAGSCEQRTSRYPSASLRIKGFLRRFLQSTAVTIRADSEEIGHCHKASLP
jgi:hypothetical protein